MKDTEDFQIIGDLNGEEGRKAIATLKKDLLKTLGKIHDEGVLDDLSQFVIHLRYENILKIPSGALPTLAMLANYAMVSLLAEMQQEGRFDS